MQIGIFLDKCYEDDYREFQYLVMDYLVTMQKYLTYDDVKEKIKVKNIIITAYQDVLYELKLDNENYKKYIEENIDDILKKVNCKSKIYFVKLTSIVRLISKNRRFFMQKY